ncbi:MAG: DinB family protein, partial [Gemmatimonadetes bacterium]|nr:DinB family protein [Gemmatimonadota bacterium]
LLARLRSTPDRLEALLAGLPDSLLRQKAGDDWSPQEHAGHLIDLEDLHLGRLRDYAAGRPELRGADLSNRRSHETRWNDDPIGEVLADFRFVRDCLLERLESADRNARALHPRLQQPMSVVDMMEFAAVHDDYHLEMIENLVRRARG